MLRFLLFAILLLTVAKSAIAANHYEMALDAFNEGKADVAYIHLKNALTDTPDHLPSKLLMGKILLQQGYASYAAEELEEALEMGADKNLVIIPLVKALLITRHPSALLDIDISGLSNDVLFDVLLLRAAAFLQEGMKQEALNSYQRALALYPTEPRILNTLALFYLGEDEVLKAEEAIIKSEDINGVSAKSLHVRGQVSEYKGDLETALALYEQANDIAQDDPVLQRAKANVLIRLGQDEEAITVLESILEQTPDDPFAKLSLGRISAKVGNEESAELIFGELTSVLSQIPDDAKTSDATLLLIEGLTAIYQDNHKQAQIKLEQFLTKRPENINAIELLARSYLITQLPSKALNLLDKKATTIAENLPLSLVLCDLYLRSNKVHRCNNLLDRLTDVYGDNASIQTMEIQVLLKRDRPEEALALYQSYFGDRSDTTLRKLYAFIHARLGRNDEALAIIEQAIQNSPEDTGLKLEQIQYLIQANRLNDAESIIDVLSSQYRDSSQLKHSRATLALRRNQPEVAVALMQDVVETSDNPDYWLTLGEAHFRAQNYQQAIDILEDVKLDLKRSSKPSELLVAIYNRLGDYESALLELDSLTSRFFIVPDYFIAKAQIYLALNDISKAHDTYNVVFGIWTENPIQLAKLARLQRKAGDIDGARLSIERALSLDTNATEIQIEYTEQLLAEGKVTEAQSTVSQLLAQNNTDIQVLMLAGNIAEARENYKEASQFYAQTLARTPQNKIAAIKLYQLAQLGLDHQRFEQALSDIVERFPNAAFQRNLLADYHLSHQRYDLAAIHYDQLIALEGFPNRDQVLNNYAIILIRQNKLAKATTIADQALNLAPNNPLVLDTRAWLYTLNAQYQEALFLLRKAYTLDSNQPTILYHLGYTLVKLERLDEAKDMLESAIASAEDFDEKPLAIRLLSEL